MTIEQKAKAYDEAISLIKDYNRDEEGFICVKPENIFPELKESKDEKIRNQIINFIEEYGNPIHCEWQKDWIAWLEKQGEPTEINPSEFDSQLNRLLKKFESLPKEELANCLSFYLNVVQNDGTYKREEKQGEQKLLNNDKYQTVSVEILDRLYESEKELEQLKQREQKPAEWSEEDENTIKDIIEDLEYAEKKGYVLKNNTFLKEINWLKSLKPQNHWKPTEAQLASLTIACDRNDRLGFDLTQLLKDLKKL